MLHPEMTVRADETRRADAIRAADARGPRAARWRDLLRRKTAGPSPRTPVSVTMRRAFPDDAEALARLAALDGAPVPQAPVLLAEVGDELWAAVSIDGDGAIADPFRPSAELLLTLAHRSRQLRPPRPPRRHHRLWRAFLRAGSS